MAMPWFRFWSEFDSDPKVQSMPEEMQRRLVMLFCERCRDVTVTLSDDDRKFHWRVTAEELASTKALFIRKGFIDESWMVQNWEKRQFVSDSSKERTKRWRDRHKIAHVTSQERHEPVTTRHCDALDTDTETETDKKKKDTLRFVPPEWIPKGPWDEFVKMRQRMRSPLTENAKKLAAAELEKIGQDPSAVINQAILKGWKSFYPLKDEQPQNKPQKRKIEELK